MSLSSAFRGPGVLRSYQDGPRNSSGYSSRPSSGLPPYKDGFDSEVLVARLSRQSPLNSSNDVRRKSSLVRSRSLRQSGTVSLASTMAIEASRGGRNELASVPIPVPQLQPFTRYDYFLLFIAIAAPLLILAFGELNRAQAWVVMNRALVRDMDNQWGYNTWAVFNESSATLDEIAQRMNNVAALYPAVLAQRNANASSSNSSFVTLTQFELYAEAVRQNGRVLFLSYSPLIESELNRVSWESYSITNQGWVEQSFAYAGQGTETNSSIRDRIWYYVDKIEKQIAPVPLGDQPYAPSWQCSPPPQDPELIVNQDYLTSEVYVRMSKWVSTGFTPVLSEPVIPELVYGSPDVVPGASAVLGTTSILTVPVYESLSNTPTQVIGFVSGVVPWSIYFENILPARIVGVQVVVDSCGSNYTWEINGESVSFVGEGDLHDAQYNQYAEVHPFADFGVPLQAGAGTFCHHRLYMFRTDAWTQPFTSAQQETLVLTMTILGSCILIAVGFVVYDYFRRLRFKRRCIAAQQAFGEDFR